MKEFNSIYEELTAINESQMSTGEYTLRLAYELGITNLKELEDFKTRYKKEHPDCIDDLTTMLINYKKELGPNFQINSMADEPIRKNLTEGKIKDFFINIKNKVLEKYDNFGWKLITKLEQSVFNVDGRFTDLINDSIVDFFDEVATDITKVNKKFIKDNYDTKEIIDAYRKAKKDNEVDPAFSYRTFADTIEDILREYVINEKAILEAKEVITIDLGNDRIIYFGDFDPDAEWHGEE